MPNIDQLSIEIEANADKARQSIHNLTASLNGLSTALNRINTSSISKFSKSLESLSTVGRRTDETSRAVQKMADSLSSSFGIKSKEGIDAMRTAMDSLLKSVRDFNQSADKTDFASKVPTFDVEKIIRDYGRIEKSVDDTTRAVYEYVKATSKSGESVSLADQAREFGENFAQMKRELGSGFTSHLKATKQGVQDFAEYLSEMNSVLGTSFDTENISEGFSQLVTAVGRGKVSVLSFNEAVSQGVIGREDATKAINDYLDGINALVKSENDLKQNNGIEALAEGLRKISDVKLPDFAPFADAIKTLNNISTDRVVNNISAIKSALDGTKEKVAQVQTAFEQTAESSGKMLPAVRDIDVLVDKMFQNFKAQSQSTKMVADGFENIRGKCELAVIQTSEFTENLKRGVEAIKNASVDNLNSSLGQVSSTLEDVRNNAEKAAQELEKASDAAGEVTGGTQKTNNLSNLAEVAEKLGARFVAAGVAVDKLSSGLNKMGNIGIAALKGMLSPLKLLQKFSEMLVEDFKEHTAAFRNMLDAFDSKANQVFSNLSRFWNRAMRTFTFMVIRKGFTAVIENIHTATQELAQFEYYANNISNGRFNASLSQIIADFQWIGRSIVAAFEPLVNYVMPILNRITYAIINVLAKVGELLAALTGQNYFVKARKTVQNYAASLQKKEKEAADKSNKEKDKSKKKEKDINKELKEREKLLLGIDELNILPKKPEDNDTLDDLADDLLDDIGDIAEGDIADIPSWADAFDIEPVSKKMQELADKIKQIARDLFEPIKKAWNEVGPYVISGFKYMVGELGKLGKSMWRDFITVWKQDATVEIFKNLFRIVGDLERVVGNLAKKFREAWDAIEGGKTRGQRIFEGIRDIIAIIIQHVRNVTKYMVEWSQKIDFSKLLKGVDDLLQKLKPLANFLGGVFEDVMKNVVLEHIRWLIEDGLPHLMEAIGDVVESFDFEGLRAKLQPVEKAFEQMRQNIDEGLVNAMKNLGQALGEWTQSDSFQKFLDAIVYFMNQVTAERVEKLFTGLGLGILKIVQALADFVSSDEFKKFIDDILAWYDSLSAEDIAKFFQGIADGIFKLVEVLAKFVDSKEFKAFITTIVDWYTNTDAEGLAKTLQTLAVVIGGFKFASFVGSGVAGFLKFLGAISAAKNLPTIAKGFQDIGTAASAAGQGAAAAGAGTAAAGASLGSVAALAAGATADLVLVGADFYNLKEASDTYTTAQKTHEKEVETSLNTLAQLYRENGPEIAAEWAKAVYDVDITGQALCDAQNTVQRKIDQTWQDIPQNMFDGFSQGWKSYFGEDGTGLLDLCGDAFTQLISGIQGLLGIASPSTVFSDIGMNVVEGFKNGITENWDAMVTAVTTLFTTLVTTISGSFTGIGTEVTTVFTQLQTTVTIALQGLVQSVTTTFTQFKTTVTTTFNAVKTTVTTAINETVNKFKEKIKEIPKNAKEKFDELKKSAQEKFKDVKQTISDKLKDTIDVVKNKLDKIKEKFQKFDLTNIAKNIIRGFTSGLKQAWADVVRWANEAVANLKKKFAEALQIQSPSKVFKEFGVYTVEGYNEGLKEASTSTTKAIDDWVAKFSTNEAALAPTLLGDTGAAQVYQTKLVADSTITKEDLKNILNEFATTLSSQKQNQRLVIELDGRKLYDSMVQQDRHNQMRTGRSAFAF